jgi:hypothetical protein
MATHYPHTAADENKQGLHYSRFLGVIHRAATDSKGKFSSHSEKSRTNPRSWANHYGVAFEKNGKKGYAKCRVSRGVIKWKGQAPEEL